MVGAPNASAGTARRSASQLPASRYCATRSGPIGLLGTLLMTAVLPLARAISHADVEISRQTFCVTSGRFGKGSFDAWK